MHRSAPRLTRILACAAVPVMLVVAGCSSDSDGGSGSAPDQGKGSASSAAPQPTRSTKTVEPAKYAKLPDFCKSISSKTTAGLVPKAKAKNGTAASSTDLTSRGGCSWNGLDDKGVKGSQYRWLDISIYRYDSDVALGSGQERAQQSLGKELAKLQATEGAKKLSTTDAEGIGDEAKAVAYELRKTGEDFRYASIVARTGNVVVLLSYNGAGYHGASTPSSKTIMDGAVKASKEAVAAVAAANK